MRQFVLIFFVFLFPLVSTAQQRHVRKANDALNERQYLTAIVYYEKGLRHFRGSDTARNNVLYSLAECYDMTRNLQKAEEIYETLTENNYFEIEPDVYFHYANVLQAQGKLKEAVGMYDNYLSVVPGNTLADSMRASCLLAQKPFVFDERFVVEALDSINTAASEFSAIYGNEDLTSIIFTSDRMGATGKDKEIDNWTGGRMSDLFVAIRHDDTISSESVLLDETGLINTPANEGTPYFNSKFTRFYFTRCLQQAEIVEYCKIYQLNKRGNKWGKPFEVYSTSAGNVGHPALSADELTLYFSSNRLGGKGGKDLWMASRYQTDEPFYNPVNLGTAINSAGDEMFPSLVGDTALFFASDGRTGYGGLDLYKALIDHGRLVKITHMPPPFNTTEDDFAIVYQEGIEKGMFSSRRKDGEGEDDIYSFKRIPLNIGLTGIVRDDSSLNVLSGAKINLFTDGGDTSISFTDEDGRYYFDSTQIKEEIHYNLFVEKMDYFNKRQKFHTYGLIKDSVFVRDVMLQPIPKKPIVLPDIYYELAKWNLLPQYEDSLMVLVEILVDNPGLVIELSSHTDFRASVAYNDDLSLKRAKTVVDFLIGQGIDPDRLVAKGYGERQPRLLGKDFKRDGYLFRKGTTLTEKYIRALPGKGAMEAAHQLNRRTEFRVLRKDFVPNKKAEQK